MSEERDDLDIWIRDVVMRISVKKEEKQGNACIDEELLACYLENLLSEAEKRKVEEHLSVCDKCLDLFLIMHKVKLQAEVAEPLVLPKKVVQRLEAVMPGGKKGLVAAIADLLLTCVNLIKSFLDTLVTIDLSPQTIRGKVAAGTQEGLVFVRQFGDVKIKLRLERVAKNRYELLLRAFSADDRLITQGLRVSLIQKTRELASNRMEEGEAHFEGIRPGKYKLRVLRNTSIVGELPLSIKGE